jgi:hypothetical protein
MGCVDSERASSNRGDTSDAIIVRESRTFHDEKPGFKTANVRRVRHSIARKAASIGCLAIMIVLVGTSFAKLAPEPRASPTLSAAPYALTDPPWVAEGNQSGENLGYSVASAGDVNDDGYEDIIVGAPNYDNGVNDEGMALVYLGSPTGLSTSPAWTAESNQAYARFGQSVSSAGDVNGDGYDDVLVGAYSYDNGETDEGRAYLYLGSSTGPSDSPAWTAEGNQASAYFGSSVASAGDVNGDGYDDVLVAASFYSSGETFEGRVFLYTGSSSGLSSTPTWTAEGNQAFAYFGRSIACAGDVNNDGYDDVIIGAYYYDDPEYNEGCAFLYLGSSSGLSASPSWIGENNMSSSWFGSYVSSAGDVNNDGYDDVVVGAVGYHNPDTDEGAAYLYLGSTSGLLTSPSWSAEGDQAYAYFGVVSKAGDVNGDGYDDVIVGAYFYDNDTLDEGRVYLYTGSSSGLSTSAAWTAEGNQYNCMFGVSISSADVNSDGFSDIIVGAYNYDNGTADTNEGRVFVFTGAGSAPPPQFDLSIVIGWNFVAVPPVGYGYKASTLGLQTGDIVSGWSPATQTYNQSFVVGVSPLLLDFAIAPSTGYWIYATSNETLHLLGDVPTTTQTRSITLPATGGWVMIGFSSVNTSRHASDIPAMYTGGNITIVASYDTATKSYTTYVVGVPPLDFLLTPGKAYWVLCSLSGTLTYEP